MNSILFSGQAAQGHIGNGLSMFGSPPVSTYGVMNRPQLAGSANQRSSPYHPSASQQIRYGPGSNQGVTPPALQPTVMGAGKSSTTPVLVQQPGNLHRINSNSEFFF